MATCPKVIKFVKSIWFNKTKPKVISNDRMSYLEKLKLFGEI